MTTNHITCPVCQHQFEAGAALASQIKSQLEAQFAAEKEQERKKLEQILQEKEKNWQKQKEQDLALERQKVEIAAAEKVAKEMQALLAQREESQKKLEEKEKKEREMQERWQTLEKEKELWQQELAQKEEKMQIELEQKLGEKMEAQKQEFLIKEREKLTLEMQKVGEKERANLLLEKEKNEQKLREMELLRLQMLEKEKKLEMEREAWRNELAQKEERERQRLAEDFAQKLEKIERENEEKVRLELAQKDKQLEQTRQSLMEAQRKATQGSQQLQGDTQEEDLKHLLLQNFCFDQVLDVATGVRGADILQNVRTQFGQDCGKILWESKRTKNWSEDWVKKLKEDQASSQAEIAIIATQVLPEGVKTYAHYKGVWVVQYRSDYLLALTCTIRHFLEEMHRLKSTQNNKQEKQEFLYNYLISNQFRQKIENIVEAFAGMKEDLEAEKRAMQRIWSKREKEISRVVHSTAGLYGDLQGIMGAKLEKIDSLELGFNAKLSSKGEELF